MQTLLLGIDIGTSGCKVAVFDLDGHLIADSTENYATYFPSPGYAEQSPDEWFEAVCRAIKDILSQGIKSSYIKAIGVAGQSWSCIPVDCDGNVLSRNPIWYDTRSTIECEIIKKQIGEDKLFSLSGNPIQPVYTMPKALWLKNKEPDIWNKTTFILQSNSFIVYRLTGVFSQDYSQGYGWNCFNISASKIESEILDEVGISSSIIPDFYQSQEIVGKVTYDSAIKTGLLAGTPVVAGGLDAACGCLGVGVIEPEQVQEQGGQAGGMSICLDAPVSEKRLILSNHVVPNRYLLQGGSVGGSGALNWFRKVFCPDKTFVEIDDAVSDIPPGCEGLVFLPYLSGERSPIWDADAKAVFFGADYSKTWAYFARSVMEGVSYSLRHNIEIACDAGAEIKSMNSMGGASKSSIWMQIKADITGKTITTPSSAGTATALGAAILAGVGIGIFHGFSDAVEKTIQLQHEFIPDMTKSEIYQRNYSIYRQLYMKLKTIMKKEVF